MKITLKNNSYHITAFFWSTFSKFISALLGFISVPLLLGVYGKADYGILSIATACNGYMHLLDLGMNVGAVKFYAQWRSEHKDDLIYRVARTNMSFYLLIGIINALGLVLLALFGKDFFSINIEQFQQLRICLFTIAFFSILNWQSTVYDQLLIANKQVAFTMKVQTLISILKFMLIFVVVEFKVSITFYFFLLTMIISLLVFPYAYKCKSQHLIDNLIPAFYWKEFKVVLVFSLSIFTLSLFQVTASQSRPIILSMFTIDGADSIANFKIIEVVPTFIIMLGGSLTSIFLPQMSELVSKNNKKETESYVYTWTLKTSILANILCIPFILSAKDFLSAYVGIEYSNLYLWLILWCVSVLIQIHTTPGNSLFIAYGKTKILVFVTAITCIFSIILNIMLSPKLGVGSAVISYLAYVFIIIMSYYLFFYNKLMHLSSKKMLKAFLYPTCISIVVMLFIWQIPINLTLLSFSSDRIFYITIFLIRSLLWFTCYLIILYLVKKNLAKNVNM